MYMTLEYDIVKYVENVGNTLHLHYTDGKVIPMVPDGRTRFLPRKGTPDTPPATYDPWVPPPTPDPGAPPPPTGSWVIPLENAVMTSGFGMRAGGFHYGCDLSTTTAPKGGPVRSVTDMIVTRAFNAYTGGNETAGTYVKGHTPDGSYTFTYNHGYPGSLLVAVGDTVTTGQKLCDEGQTGNVTGTHLHFEIIEGNWPDPWAPPYNYGANFVDPLPVLRAHGVDI